ncbi:2-keto-4-pentenoate hydratase [Polaromonas sp. OV174]|uniref:fumarylacetoacetate hydrolase family protein n=1 Tax=Polaromonas sp. OV174 TaxID=1855300 RepID=UPI0008EA9A68|nr:fumarylacetoacetate hydrolase family protein [Polaromonas sp. OV174]SFC58907.1 2-keto-4-pentenoate hydratase [Polaromonas sp. OV174]
MSDPSVESIVNLLLQARRDHRLADAAKFSETLTSSQQAYAVQEGVANALGWYGTEGAMHWKSGGPSRQVTLTHAPLPPAGVWASPAAAGAFGFTARGIEAEVALRLGQSVDATMSATIDEASASKLIEAMTVSIEVVDSRWTGGMSAPALLRLADLQSHGALVLGEWTPWVPRDWARQSCRVFVGQQPVIERQGTHSLGNPVWGLGAWLRHATQGGKVVAAGTVLTTGTWVGILNAAAGDRVIAEFDGIGTAEVQL